MVVLFWESNEARVAIVRVSGLLLLFVVLIIGMTVVRITLCLRLILCTFAHISDSSSNNSNNKNVSSSSSCSSRNSPTELLVQKVIFRICVCDICEFVMERAEVDAVSDLKAKAVAAVEEGDVLVLEQLLRESDLDLNTITTTTTADDDRSLLMVACEYKHLHVVKWL